MSINIDKIKELNEKYKNIAFKLINYINNAYEETISSFGYSPKFEYKINKDFNSVEIIMIPDYLSLNFFMYFISSLNTLIKMNSFNDNILNKDLLTVNNFFIIRFSLFLQEKKNNE